MFITLEGPEGAGKSTVARNLVKLLEEVGHDVVLTREPGSGQVGTKIRAILLEGIEIDPKCELFLFLADRSQHSATLVRPSLEAGKTVLCDRYADSTVVYQGHARGFDLDMLRKLNDLATNGLKPDLTLLLDLDPAIGVARITQKDRLDNEPIEFHQRVREGFAVEAQLEPERWVTIDASQPIEDVTAACWRAVKLRL